MTKKIDSAIYPGIQGYDVVVVGVGGASLRATFGMAESGLRQPVLVNYFQQEAIQWQHEEGLAPLLAIWEVMIGAGICTIQSRVLIGWAIKTQSNICVKMRCKL